MDGDIGTEAVKLWDPINPQGTPMGLFMEDVNNKYNLSMKSYSDLYDWSVDNISTFWAEVWRTTGIKASQMYDDVVDETAPMFPRPPFFRGARLNFAENILFPTALTDDSGVAVISATEVSREEITWTDLRERVRRCQAGMRAAGVAQGDRVAGYVGNHANSVVAMLAATSLGAIWTANSPDMGVHAVLERLRQIEPTILFADNGSYYNGKIHSAIDKVRAVVEQLPTLSDVVVDRVVPLDSLSSASAVPEASGVHLHGWDSFCQKLNAEDAPLHFEQLPPDHPVYILYSSGTTGAPKCIVHGAAGTLIQHKKEHALHCSMGPESRMFYYTTTAWMMWHWLVSALASGSSIVLYSGSPFRSPSTSSTTPPPPTITTDTAPSVADDLAMLRLLAALNVTHFGTSAKYLTLLEQSSIFPLSASLPLSTLLAIYSTGSPLPPSTFHYIYASFPPKINLASITGGTDIISLFGAPCPLLPVHAGEIQCRALAMAVRNRDSLHPHLDLTATAQAGDLVCVRPFPSQPVSFWGPDGDHKYRASYFSTVFAPSHPTNATQTREFTPDPLRPLWHHGDFIRISPQTKGLTMLGRSDGVLKPQGVRFGSAEIYNVLSHSFSALIEDALCVGRRRATDTDETVVLFLKLKSGGGGSGGAGAPEAVVDEELVARVKGEIRTALSARHVPGVVVGTPEIPVTANGKKVEGVVKKILCGVEVGNEAAVANRGCLGWYRAWAEENQ